MSDIKGSIEIAEQLQKAGTDLLAGGVEKVLRTCGDIVYSGSYFLNLMAWPDIDIYLYLDPSPEYQEKFLNIGPHLDSVCDVISLRYKNHIKYPAEPLPNGLYWGARINQKTGYSWKLDIWAVSPDIIECNKAEMNRLKSRITPGLRKHIVDVKQALLTTEGRTPVFSGYHIYCAVIDHGLRSIGEVTEYIRKKGVMV
jgi:hypothetical protein